MPHAARPGKPHYYAFWRFLWLPTLVLPVATISTFTASRPFAGEPDAPRRLDGHGRQQTAENTPPSHFRAASGRSSTEPPPTERTVQPVMTRLWIFLSRKLTGAPGLPRAQTTPACLLRGRPPFNEAAYLSGLLVGTNTGQNHQHTEGLAGRAACNIATLHTLHLPVSKSIPHNAHCYHGLGGGREAGPGTSGQRLALQTSGGFTGGWEGTAEGWARQC